MRYVSACGTVPRARPRDQLMQVGRAAPGVERPAQARLGEPVDGGRPGGFDVGQQRQLTRDVRDQRAGRHGRQVGLDQDVLDRRRERRRQHLGDLVAVGPSLRLVARAGRGGVRGIQQPPPGAGQRAAPGDAEELRLVERPGADLLDVMAAAGRHPPAQPGGKQVEVRRMALAGCGERPQHVAAQLARAGTDHVVREQRAGLRTVLVHREPGQLIHPAPGRRQQRPALGHRSIPPPVVALGRHHHRIHPGGTADQRSSTGRLHDQRDDGLLHAQRFGRAPQLTHRQAARSRQRRRALIPTLDEQLEQPQRVQGGSRAPGVYVLGRHSAACNRRRMR